MVHGDIETGLPHRGHLRPECRAVVGSLGEDFVLPLMNHFVRQCLAKRFQCQGRVGGELPKQRDRQANGLASRVRNHGDSEALA